MIIFLGVNMTFFPIHFLAWRGCPGAILTTRIDLPTEIFLLGSGLLFQLSLFIFFLFILWEAFVRHRPAISSNHLRTSLEMIHSFPPMNHRYTSIPLVIQ